MGVATHLNIRLEEYDARIQTFIPGYEQMIEAAAGSLGALASPARLIVELGIGTGALAARAVARSGAVRIVGIDEDAGMLALAAERLAAGGAECSLVHGSFLDVPIPPCDAVVSSLALHHVASRARKQELYGDIARALADGGLLVTADCFPSRDPLLARLERDGWRAHLRAAYSDGETDEYFATWAREDTYLPLDDELAMMRRVGLDAEVIWRVAPMAVVAARRVRTGAASRV